MLETTATTDEGTADEGTTDEGTADESTDVSVNSIVQYYFLPNQDLPTDNNWK